MVTELGTKVDASASEISVDGHSVRVPATKTYLALHKPRGVISTCRDPKGRPTVLDLVPERLRGGLYPVGRLDAESEGLVLLTNDGELVQRLTHPRYGVLKVYEVLVAGEMARETLGRLREGVRLEEGLVVPEKVEIVQRKGGRTRLHVELGEGHNREIRRLMERAGHKVVRLVRQRIGPLQLGELERGAFRRLRREEVAALRRAAGMETADGDD